MIPLLVIILIEVTFLTVVTLIKVIRNYKYINRIYKGE